MVEKGMSILDKLGPEFEVLPRHSTAVCRCISIAVEPVG